MFECWWFGCYGRWLFLRGIFVHGGDSFEANVRPVKEWSQLPKIGAVKSAKDLMCCIGERVEGWDCEGVWPATAVCCVRASDLVRVWRSITRRPVTATRVSCS